MRCPYCGKEMTAGTLSGDGKTMLKFSPKNGRSGIFNMGKIIRNVNYNFARFEIKADHCETCGKIIFDAKI